MSTKPFTGRKVLITLIAFFAVILSVNGVFAYFALATFPGLDQRDPYEHGLKYNAVLDDARKQQALGWHSDATLGGDGELLVHIDDRYGVPVLGLTMTAQLSRPLGLPQEREIVLAPMCDGAYLGWVDAPSDGRWYADISAVDPDGHQYRMRHQIELRP